MRQLTCTELSFLKAYKVLENELFLQLKSSIEADIFEEEKARTAIRISMPEIIEVFLEVDKSHQYNPDFGDYKLCKCGHAYYRHFDSYEDMAPVGCEYCSCREFQEGTKPEVLYGLMKEYGYTCITLMKTIDSITRLPSKVCHQASSDLVLFEKGHRPTPSLAKVLSLIFHTSEESWLD